MTWPHDDPASLDAFYGPLSLGRDGRPTRKWEGEHLESITSPYPLAIAWMPGVTVRRVLCHRKVAGSLARIFAAILAHYGTPEAVAAARMHLYGGCYAFRPVRGGNRLSVHAYGAAVDLDPEGNPLGKEHDCGPLMMPAPVVAIFEAEKWTWGGRFRNRPDCMHFQAATP